MSRTANARSLANADGMRRRHKSRICPITAGVIRPGRRPSATTGVANTNMFSNDDRAGSN
jgi:hypothetical protein